MNQAIPPAPRRRDIDRLLQLGADAARGGNRQAARSLFLALAREHPDDLRAWLGLASVAASRNEQREALQHVVALDPGNQRAREALARLGVAPPAPSSAATTRVLPETAAALPAPDVAVAPWKPSSTVLSAGAAADELAEGEQPRTPFPLLNTLAMGLILLLLVAVGLVLGRALWPAQQRAALPTATAELILQPAPASTGVSEGPTAAAAPSAAAQAPAATFAPEATPALLPTADAVVNAPAVPTAASAAGDSATLPLGTVVDYDGWSAVLLRPDYALTLDGAIGDLQPSGRFVLAVVAVSNNAPAARTIPADMFVLTDSAGRQFLPVPGASSAYLALYERAQRGDLALEDAFAPSSGMLSVPILFDAPPDASGLRLSVSGAGPAGWPVGEPGPSPAPSGP